MSENLPLGYFVSVEQLLEYGRKITDHPMPDEDVISFAMFKVLFNADADNSDAQWTTSAHFSPDNAVFFLQISGGGGPQEWRIPADVETRLCTELGLQGPAVRFQPIE